MVIVFDLTIGILSLFDVIHFNQKQLFLFT